MSVHPTRLRRSVLYLPGSNARALVKAATLPADSLILDLEDAVAPEAKALARSQVVAAVKARSFGHREVVVRVNGIDTEWVGDDLAAVATAGADAVLLPKIGDPAEVADAIARLDAAGAPADLPVWIMTETARGVLALDTLLASQRRIRVVVMGTSDLSRELRVRADAARTGLLHSLSHCVLAARAHRVDIIDGVCLALDDSPEFRSACEQGRALGFDGKSLIHPRQIEFANACFGVGEPEVIAARTIVSAWETARASGAGLAVVQDRLVEELHADEARRVLALHQAIKDRDNHNNGKA